MYLNGLDAAVVGDARAVIELILVLNASTVGFPLDEALHSQLKRARGTLEALASAVGELANFQKGSPAERDMVAGVVSSGATVWTEDFFTLWMSAYAGSDRPLHLSLHDEKTLRKELVPILLRKWSDLLRSLLALRMAEHADEEPGQGSVVLEGLRKLATLVASIVPPGLGLPESGDELLRDPIVKWISEVGIAQQAKSTFSVQVAAYARTKGWVP